MKVGVKYISPQPQNAESAPPVMTWKLALWLSMNFMVAQNVGAAVSALSSRQPRWGSRMVIHTRRPMRTPGTPSTKKAARQP